MKLYQNPSIEMKDDQFKLGDILLLINDLVKSKFDKVKDEVLNHLYLNIDNVSKHLEVKHVSQSFLEDLLRKDEKANIGSIPTK